MSPNRQEDLWPAPTYATLEERIANVYVSEVVANHYNPSTVAQNEMRLLYLRLSFSGRSLRAAAGSTAIIRIMEKLRDASRVLVGSPDSVLLYACRGEQR
jgi:hypothetical protein